MLSSTDYAPRPARLVSREARDGWRLKLYGLALPGREPRPEFLDAVRATMFAALPEPSLEDGRPGAGFVVAHDAATVCYALVYWWHNANELHMRTFVAPLDDPAALSPVDTYAAGCVHELAIVDYESRAWVRDVLAPGLSQAGVDRWMERELAGVV